MRRHSSPCKIADLAHVAGAFLDADHAARLQQVEDVTGLDRLLIGGDRQFRGQAVPAFGHRFLEQVEQRIGFGHFEIPRAHLLFVFEKHLAVTHSFSFAYRFAA